MGESSRAAAAREPATVTMDTLLGDQQGQLERLRGQMYQILASRLGVVEGDVGGLVVGRVGLDVSQKGLETRQVEDRGQIILQSQQLAFVWDMMISAGTREAALQLRIEQLEGIAVAMDQEIKRLQGGPSGAPGGA